MALDKHAARSIDRVDGLRHPRRLSDQCVGAGEHADAAESSKQAGPKQRRNKQRCQGEPEDLSDRRHAQGCESAGEQRRHPAEQKNKVEICRLDHERDYRDRHPEQRAIYRHRAVFSTFEVDEVIELSVDNITVKLRP